MTDPSRLPPTTINSPFDPRPVQPSGGGCGRVALIGCGGLLLLLGVAAVVFVLNARAVLRWGLEWSQRQIQTQIEQTLPADVTAADRDRLRAAFTAATAKVTSEQADPADLARMQEEIQRVLPKLEKGLTRDDLVRLTTVLEEIAAPDASPEQPDGADAARESGSSAAGEAEEAPDSDGGDAEPLPATEGGSGDEERGTPEAARGEGGSGS
jgi:hypothetical protein